jgi:hypothetical protein
MVAAPVQSPRPKPRSLPPWIAGVVVFVFFALVFLVGGHFVWGVYQASRPVEFPVTLDALDVATDTTTQSIGDAERTALATQNPNVDVQVRVYGGTNFASTITAAVTIGSRSVQDLDAFDKSLGLGAVTTVGTSQCASSGAQHTTVCLRTDGSQAVVVTDVARSGTQGEADVAAMVDQVWQS